MVSILAIPVNSEGSLISPSLERFNNKKERETNELEELHEPEEKEGGEKLDVEAECELLVFQCIDLSIGNRFEFPLI